MEKVEPIATPTKMRAGKRSNGSEVTEYMSGVAEKQSMPIIIINFLPKRSERPPRGIAKSALENPEAEMRAPIKITDAPMVFEKEGKMGVTTL
jgi:hypothetical protein